MNPDVCIGNITPYGMAELLLTDFPASSEEKEGVNVRDILAFMNKKARAVAFQDRWLVDIYSVISRFPEPIKSPTVICIVIDEAILEELTHAFGNEMHNSAEQDRWSENIFRLLQEYARNPFPKRS